ncbi:hypothetical protein BBO99_00003320 [Phytophthora kernoviae]|uniref:SEC7 domain-containing protein n=2 Tax=Phytophthora kernoviae TaxID=325452 RepID=A0A3R7JH04_9STRA|nr:hypothetical protein G195_002823 [Phytophthora kernoviae 00238/432]KAG2528375.1 hypothetical protein JM16_002921 [Phytophthora kernoviae]KAG2532585.1 hypothetical protein JM18_000464 [Phytophthora kernoviae]RLN46273.1 hypothetical protein BBI17_003315 [Phytophthora kernoviae]RLN81889.1 hypothetical protein BBO99_00003320 [Phytophthora kernoviae]
MSSSDGQAENGLVRPRGLSSTSSSDSDVSTPKFSPLPKLSNGTSVAFDVALRVYLARFELPSEAQKIDRIIEAFAKAYYESNQDSLECPSEDAVYTLAFSVLLLNTDAHNPRLARRFKMMKGDFVRNYHHLGGDGGSARPEVPDSYLAQCYDLFVMDAIKRIERKPDELLPDEVELEFPDSSLGLEIETSFDGRTCIVKSYGNDRHTYSSRRRRPSSGSRTSVMSAIPRAINAILAIDREPPEPSLAGWVIVAVGNDSTRQLGYNLSRYLLKTASRPVRIRFCEPSAYFESLE